MGIIFALCACFVWGLIFVVPQLMTGFLSIEVALGRYLVYGIMSSLLFLRAFLNKECRYPKAIWLRALGYSLVITFGYYTFVVLSLRYSSPAICTLILGICPITIAFYGNWQQKDTYFKSLIIPSILIVIGLVIINIPHLRASASPSNYFLGLGFSLLSLISWTWYVVSNSRFLKQHPEVNSAHWTTLIGVSTLVWVVVCGLILGLFFKEQLNIDKYFVPNDELKRFIIGSLILGLLCSWVGGFLWNRATQHLPVSLAGQLMVFETIFGVLFVYLIQQSIPSVLEFVGIVILLAAVLFGIRKFAKKQQPAADEVLPD